MFNDPRNSTSSVSHPWLVSISVCALVMTGCGTALNTAVSAATTATSPSATPAAPATLKYISPGAVMAGTAGANVTLQGDSINTNAIVLMDGAAHAADYVSNSEVHVPLTAAELSVSERHNFSVQNPQAVASDAKTLLVSSWYNAFGDSITQGYNLDLPATQNYSALLAATLNLTETNNSIGGDQACDVFPLQIYPSGTGYTAQPAPLQSLMVGTNDTYVKGTGAYEAIFNTCHLAALAWLGTPRNSRLMAGDTGLSTTGDCANTASADNFGGLACRGAGAITATLTTSGNAMYIWYTLSDDAADSSFQVSLDGTLAGTYNTLPSVPISTKNGGHSGVALIRLPASAGVHTVAITTTTGGIGIQGIGSNPSAGADLPRVLVGDLPNQYVTTPLTPVSAQLIYNADITANVAQLSSDGIDLRLAPTRSYMLGTYAEMHDILHPNALGHQHLEAAFLSVLP